MTTKTSTILSRAATLLQDASNVRWTLLELFGYISDGQKEVCIHKPSAYTKVSSVLLVEGTKQTLPSDGLSLFDVVRNMGTGGSTPGNAIRLTPRELMDVNSPGWHSSTASATAKHYTYDSKNTKVYYVYPPQPAASQGYVEIIYGAVPPDLVAPGAYTVLSSYDAVLIDLDDIYANPLVDYVLFRAYSKDAEYAAAGGIAEKYLAAFIARVTGKTTAESSTDPNVPGVK